MDDFAVRRKVLGDQCMASIYRTFSHYGVPPNIIASINWIIVAYSPIYPSLVPILGQLHYKKQSLLHNRQA